MLLRGSGSTNGPVIDPNRNTFVEEDGTRPWIGFLRCQQMKGGEIILVAHHSGCSKFFPLTSKTGCKHGSTERAALAVRGDRS